MTNKTQNTVGPNVPILNSLYDSLAPHYYDCLPMKKSVNTDQTILYLKIIFYDRSGELHCV